MLKILALCMFVGYAAAFDFCSICEAGVAEVIKIAGDNEDKAKELLDKECATYLHHGWEVDICDGAVNLAVGEIMDLIKQGLSPATICQKVHLCNGRSALIKANPLGNICKACPAIVNKIVNTVGNDASEIIAECKKYVPAQYGAYCSYVVGILEKLVASYGNDADKICGMIPFCKQTASQNFQAAVAPKASGNLCQYCEEAVNVLANLLKNEVPTFINDIKSLCNKLPGDEAQICSALVDQYGSMIFDKVISLLNGQTVCTGIHLCNSKIENLFFDRSSGDGVNWDPVKCNFCKMVFQFIQQNFMSQDFLNALLMDIAKACKEIESTSVQQQCLNIIATYGDMILNYAKQLISPDHVCPMMKMCPSS